MTDEPVDFDAELEQLATGGGSAPPPDDVVATLKRQLADLEAKVAAQVERISTATGGMPEEVPASITVVLTLVEALFGGPDDPQRITFDMRLASNRLRWLEGIDTDEVLAELDAQEAKVRKVTALKKKGGFRRAH